MQQFSYFSRSVWPLFSRIGSTIDSIDHPQMNSKINSPPPSDNSPIDMAAPDAEQDSGQSVPIMTEIHSAIVAGANAETVEEIIGYDGEKNSNDVNDIVCGFTAAMLVCLYGGSVETLKVLVKHGAELNVKDGHQCNMLHFACASVKFEIVQYVVETAEAEGYLDSLVSDKDEWGNSVAHYVACKHLTEDDAESEEQAIKIVKFLKEKGCNMDIRNNDGQSPLHWASNNSNEKLAEHMTALGSNPYTPDASGLTASQAVNNPQHFVWETPNFLRLEGREDEKRKEQGQTDTSYVSYPNQALQGLDVLTSFGSVPTGQSDMHRLALHLQQLQQPQDWRSIFAQGLSKETILNLTMMEQLLYQQNQQMNDKVTQLQRENMLLRTRLLSLEQQVEKYKVELEQSAQIVLNQFGGGMVNQQFSL